LPRGNNQERFVFELTHDRATGDDAPDIATLSRGLNVYYMKNIQLGDSKFNIAPGLGIANRQLYMRNVYDFDAVTGIVTLPEVPEGLERNSSKGDFFELEAGDVVFSEKFKLKRLDNIVPWRIAPGFRVGYGSLNLFGYYQVNKDFDAGLGPDQNGYTLGVSISSF